jgi:hypothetical protein
MRDCIFRLSRGFWEPQLDRGSLAQLAVEDHKTAGLFGKARDHRQTEACSLAHSFGGEDGSRAFSSISSSIPLPWSITLGIRDAAAQPPEAMMLISRPAGMAPRAFRTRFRRAIE